MDVGDFNAYESLSAGLSRAKQTLETEISPDQIFVLSEKIVNVFGDYADDLNYRFLALFTEMAAISEAPRLVYGYPSLTQDELQDFLYHAVTFFDSFTHK